MIAGRESLVTEINFTEFIQVQGKNDQLAVRSWRDCGPSVEVNGSRQHEAVVVIGVLADQVDTAWRAENSRLWS